MPQVFAECGSCAGTGLYKGFAERDGYAVVCSRCHGTGCQIIKYQEFGEKRKPPKDVHTVLECNPGIQTGGTVNFGGISYEEWNALKPGEPFPPKTEMRKSTCPAWWYQTADYKKKPDWEECSKNLGRSFSHCPHFPDKHKCWAKWDKENPECPT